MAPRKKSDPKLDLPALGEEGDVCEECGSALAIDQRYCLNCGTRRGGSRLDYEQMLFANAGGGLGGNGGTMAMAATAPVGHPGLRDWTPAVAVGAIAVLGAMLLLGVLIGKKDNGTTQVTAAPTATTAAAAPTAAPTDAAAAAAAAKNKTAAAGAAGGNAVKGGSGSTAGIPTAAAPSTGKAASDASKNSPDVVATQGAPAQQDPNGAAGGGSKPTCIGSC
ncbi:MAG: hypothetical protein QOD60_1626 [Solirubrobacterales bacterium]|jgi:hypothetical protein|nr:hypothetical protein [Solirubrobacterales bacterium]